MFGPIIALLLSFADPDAAEGLRRTAPGYLSPEASVQHSIAARAAAWSFSVRPSLLLSIAHHESNYSHTEVTPEPTVGAGFVSCGVMTPEPTRDRAACAAATKSILDGYLVGAAHLRRWLDGQGSYCAGNIRCALLGYAGGHALIAACAKGPVLRVTPSGTLDSCSYPDVFLWRAGWIDQEIERQRRRVARPQS